MVERAMESLVCADVGGGTVDGVKGGCVRIVIGSSERMRAHTNVQQPPEREQQEELGDDSDAVSEPVGLELGPGY